MIWNATEIVIIKIEQVVYVKAVGIYRYTAKKSLQIELRKAMRYDIWKVKEERVGLKRILV